MIRMVDANAVKERTAKKGAGRPRASGNVASHKHCKICSINIDVKSDPRICKSADCIAKNEKNQKNDKMMRIMFFVFFAAVVAPIFLSLLGYGGG